MVLVLAWCARAGLVLAVLVNMLPHPPRSRYEIEQEIVADVIARCRKRRHRRSPRQAAQDGQEQRRNRSLPEPVRDARAAAVGAPAERRLDIGEDLVLHLHCPGMIVGPIWMLSATGLFGQIDDCSQRACLWNANATDRTCRVSACAQLPDGRIKKRGHDPDWVDSPAAQRRRTRSSKPPYCSSTSARWAAAARHPQTTSWSGAAGPIGSSPAGRSRCCSSESTP